MRKCSVARDLADCRFVVVLEAAPKRVGKHLLRKLPISIPVKSTLDPKERLFETSRGSIELIAGMYVVVNNSRQMYTLTAKIELQTFADASAMLPGHTWMAPQTGVDSANSTENRGPARYSSATTSTQKLSRM